MPDPIPKIEKVQSAFSTPKITELDRKVAIVNDRISGIALIRLQEGDLSKHIAVFVNDDLKSRNQEKAKRKKIHQLLDRQIQSIPKDPSKIDLINTKIVDFSQMDESQLLPEEKEAYSKVKDVAVEEFSKSVKVEGSISKLLSSLKNVKTFSNWKEGKRLVLMRKDFEQQRQGRFRRTLSRLGNLITRGKFKTSAEIADDYIQKKEERLLRSKNKVLESLKPFLEEFKEVGGNFYLDFEKLGIRDENEKALVSTFLKETLPKNVDVSADDQDRIDLFDIPFIFDHATKLLENLKSDVDAYKETFPKDAENQTFYIERPPFKDNPKWTQMVNYLLPIKANKDNLTITIFKDNDPVRPKNLLEADAKTKEIIEDLKELAPKLMMDNIPKFDFDKSPFSSLNPSEQEILKNKYVRDIPSDRKEAEFPPKIWRDYQVVRKQLSLTPENLQLTARPEGKRSVFVDFNAMIKGSSPKEKNGIVNQLNKEYEKFNLQFIADDPLKGVRLPQFFEKYALEKQAILGNAVPWKKRGVLSKLIGGSEQKTFLIDDSRYNEKEIELIKEDLGKVLAPENSIVMQSHADPELILNKDIEKIAGIIREDLKDMPSDWDKCIHLDFQESKYTDDQKTSIHRHLGTQFEEERLIFATVNSKEQNEVVPYLIYVSGETYAPLTGGENVVKHTFQSFKNIDPKSLPAKGGVTIRRKPTVRKQQSYDAMPTYDPSDTESVSETTPISDEAESEPAVGLNDEELIDLAGEIAFQSFKEPIYHIVVDFTMADNLNEDDRQRILDQMKVREGATIYTEVPEGVEKEDILRLAVREWKDTEGGASLFTVEEKPVQGLISDACYNRMIDAIKAKWYLGTQKFLVLDFIDCDCDEEIIKELMGDIRKDVQELNPEVKILRSWPEDEKEKDILQLSIRYQNPDDGFESFKVEPRIPPSYVHTVIADLELEIMAKQLAKGVVRPDQIYLDFSGCDLNLEDQKVIQSEVARFYENQESSPEILLSMEGIEKTDKHLHVKIQDNPIPTVKQPYLIEFVD